MKTEGYVPPEDGWVSPSLKKIKMPVIHIGDKSVYERIEKWFNENPEADNLLPPYKEYIIHLQKSELKHEIIVHYDDSFRKLHAQLVTDGKKRMMVYANFDMRMTGNRLACEGEVPDARKYDCEHINLIAEQVVAIITTTQAYILNFKPEIIEKEVQEGNIKGTEKRKNNIRDKKIARTKEKYIYLTGKERQHKEREFRKIQWSVRGHYRKVGDRFIYVKPHTAKRGEKNRKIKEGKVIIE